MPESIFYLLIGLATGGFAAAAAIRLLVRLAHARTARNIAKNHRFAQFFLVEECRFSWRTAMEQVRLPLAGAAGCLLCAGIAVAVPQPRTDIAIGSALAAKAPAEPATDMVLRRDAPVSEAVRSRTRPVPGIARRTARGRIVLASLDPGVPVQGGFGLRRHKDPVPAMPLLPSGPARLPFSEPDTATLRKSAADETPARDAGQSDATGAAQVAALQPAGQVPAVEAAAKEAEKASREALRCLATAVYFEARGEPEKGQVAVAQVVLNRVEHWFYPDDICSVVFQQQHMRNQCQFSFACDGRSDRPRSKVAWARALKVAKRVLNKEVYLEGVGRATHYHANYVRPYWLRDMRKVDRIGRHIFYRVRWWS